jgi:putative cell wall-binding protein
VLGNTARASRKAIIAVAASAGLILSGVAFAATPSFAAAASFTISGQITVDQSAGSPIPATSATATLYDLTGSSSTQVAQTVGISGGSGNYSFTGVAPGRYRIFVSGTNTTSSWLGSPFKDESTVVNVTTADVANENVALPVGGSISGTVTTAPTSWESLFAQGDVVATAHLLDPNTYEFDQANKRQVTVGSNGAYTISNLVPGQYSVRFADATGIEPPQLQPAYYPTTGLMTVTAGATASGADADLTYHGDYFVGNDRLAGSDRYGTAVDVSQSFFSSSSDLRSSTIFIASGQNYPDALSASAAAAIFGGPLLLVQTNAVPTEVTAEIERLNPTYIVVVGGTAAVSAAVYQNLSTMVGSGDINRISGADRFATSRAVATYAFGGQNAQTHLQSVFIATGDNYPDALVAGGAAGYDSSPVLLVNGSDSSLDQATLQLLQTLAPDRIYIVGGDAAISTGIEKQLDATSTAEVLRLSGADRFGTAEAVNSEVFPFSDYAYLATASGYADALAISAVSGTAGSPLYLTTASCIPMSTWNASNALGTTTYFTVGGTAVISDSVAEDLDACQQTNTSSKQLTAPLTKPGVTPASHDALPPRKKAAKF